MTESIDDSELYKIPSDAVIKHRKEFYALVRKKDEQSKVWLNRVQKQMKCCKFPKLVEYLLIDKFMCELNHDEKNAIRIASGIWSVKQLNEYFDHELRSQKYRAAKEIIHTDQGADECKTLDIVKLEAMVWITKNHFRFRSKMLCTIHQLFVRIY